MLAEVLKGLVRPCRIERPDVPSLLVDHLRSVLAAPLHDGHALEASFGDLLDASKHIVGGYLCALGAGVHRSLDGIGDFNIFQ